MGKAGAARKLASAAAYGGGGLSVLGGGLYGVLTAEAQARPARDRRGRRRPPPDATGWYGRGRPGPAIKIVLLGDSSAAGYGVDRVEETPGALLASGVAERADRRVYLRAFAKVGAQSSDLEGQLDRALPIEPDVAVILIGVNDVTHRVRPATPSAPSPKQCARLRDAGVAVLVGTCPDLGTVKPIPPPLKQVARDLVASAGRGADHRRHRGRRPDRVAGLGPRARSSRRRRRCCSAPTGSTPRPPATGRWPPCWCPRCSRPSA